LTVIRKILCQISKEYLVDKTKNKQLTWFVTRLEERQLQTRASNVRLHLYKGLGIPGRQPNG